MIPHVLGSLAWAFLAGGPLFLHAAPIGNDDSFSGAVEKAVLNLQSIPASMTFEQAEPALDKALEWLVSGQNEDGSWGTGAMDSTMELGFSVESFYAWQVASHALACMALLECEETPERRAALEKGLDWLVSTRIPKRGNHWDVDFAWSTLYGLVAVTRAAQDSRFGTDDWAGRLAERGRAFIGLLEHTQTPEGGWAYYDDPPFSQRPKWATSFCTALILPALRASEELGWLRDEKVRLRAIEYVRRCAMPGGAYAYDFTVRPRIDGGEHINRVKGSLGRIQVCNYGLRDSGVEWVTLDKIRAGLEDFFRHHRFLEVARMRPIPHEAYYANAGYFYFFGHYYAAEAINALPEAERETFHARLRPHLVKVQFEDGSTSDFLISRYMKTASTSYLALALQLGRPAGESSNP
jgi:hypothetical protein